MFNGHHDGEPAVQLRWFYAIDAPRLHSGQACSVSPSLATGASTQAHNGQQLTRNGFSAGVSVPAPGSTDADAAAFVDASTRAATVVAAAAVAARQAADKPQQPTIWEPFSEEDSRELEAAYQRSKTASPSASESERCPLVEVQEDRLFEVDVRARLLRPVYWRGNAYEVRRAAWFYQVGGKFEPCEENLSRQIEDGYAKFKPWLLVDPDVATTACSINDGLRRASTMPTMSPALGAEEVSPSCRIITSATAPLTTDSGTINPDVMPRWPLLGPYMGNSVLFRSARTAWLLSGNFTESIMAKLTNKENMGGAKLVRGWDEVERLTHKSDKLKKERPAGTPSNSQPQSPESVTKEAESRPNAQKIPGKRDRRIDHLVLVIHGIGQKMSEKTNLVSIVNDCNVLRQGMKDPAATIASYGKHAKKTANDPDLPLGRGVQVLPVEWRHGISFGMGGERALGDGLIVCKNTSDDDDDEDSDDDDMCGFASRPCGNDSGSGAADDLQDMSGSDEESLFSGRRSSKMSNMSTASSVTQRSSKRSSNGSRRSRLIEQGPQVFLPSLAGITLSGIPLIRTLVSDVILDVLLFMMPKYRVQMYDAVTSELNRVYKLFVKRHPNFIANGGRVSILGHSLGSMLAFDILCGQRSRADAWTQLRYGAAQRSSVIGSDSGNSSSHSRSSRRWNSIASAATNKSNSSSLPALDFTVTNLITLGSPIGLFMLLKGSAVRARGPDGRTYDQLAAYGIDGTQSQRSSMLGLEGTPYGQFAQPLVENYYNVYHRADPVAYRVEPLIDPEMQNTPPKSVPYTKGGLRGLQLGMHEVSTGIADKASSMFATMRTSIRAVSIFKSLGKEAAKAKAEKESGDSEHEQEHEQQRREDDMSLDARFSDPKEHLNRLNYTGRVDWCLQEGVLENEYLVGLQVHVNYWSDSDVSTFVLRECARTSTLD